MLLFLQKIVYYFAEGKDMLKIDNLSFGYIKQPLIIKDLNLCLKEGEKALILGGEGMGKTSLLKILAGLEKQYFGEILINGENVKEFENKNKSVSFLPNEPVLLNGSLRKNLDYLFKIENLSLNDNQIYDIFKKFNFDYDLKVKVRKLPLVDKRIFAIIRSYIKKSKLLLIDDQFEGLDDLMINKIKNAIMVLCGENNGIKTALVVNNFDCGIGFNKCFYLSYARCHALNSINKLYENPIDLNSVLYCNFNQKNMVLTKKNDEYFICGYIEKFDKKRKNAEIIIKNMYKINKNQVNIAEKTQIDNEEYIKIVLLSKDEINEEILNHISNCLNKSVFLFDLATGERVI